MYKTVVVKYSPKAKEMAAKIEAVANQMEQKGFILVSCSIMPSSKGILVFKKTRNVHQQNKPILNNLQFYWRLFFVMAMRLQVFRNLIQAW